VTSIIHTIFFLPFRENICPALLRKVEQIPYQWITRWPRWNLFGMVAQPLIYNTQNGQDDPNAGVQRFNSEHAGQGIVRHLDARVRNISEGQQRIPESSIYEGKVRRNWETAQCSHTLDTSVSRKQGIRSLDKQSALPV
jgi:hypothetical protein